MPVIRSLGYTIEIGNTIFRSISIFLKKKKFTSHVIICDENTIQYCLPLLLSKCPQLNTAHIIEIESGESSKSLEFCSHIWQTLLENGADKNSLVINLGGGVVSDLGGFCASTYKRGISFINIPTTLLSMADASVGGKTGIDFSGIKNSIGTFSQPVAVFIYPAFLDTLPERHIKNGFAEILKMALIMDLKFCKELRNSSIEKNKIKMLQKSVSLKNKIVLKDPLDNGIRKILNFGHTIGHAIESCLLGTEDELLHGEAVAIGMIIESLIAYDKKLLKLNELQLAVDLIKTNYSVLEFSDAEVDKIIELMLQDKKNKNNKIRMSLINKIGSCKYDIEVIITQIQKAFKTYHQIIGA